MPFARNEEVYGEEEQADFVYKIVSGVVRTCRILSDGRRFALGLTQADLAEICGLTTVHVNRVMRQLREEQICIFRSSLVEILDPVRLATRGQFNPAYLYIADDERLPSVKRPKTS